jgi:hypothetical protein
MKLVAAAVVQPETTGKPDLTPNQQDTDTRPGHPAATPRDPRCAAGRQSVD